MRNKRIYFWIVIFVIGFGIMIYPTISQFYYKVEFKSQVSHFSQEIVSMDNAEIKRRIGLAEAYNTTLDPSKLVDPYDEKQKEGLIEYARMLEVNEQIGHVEIPKIDEDIPIYAGTPDSVLNKGAGHLEGTSLPIGGVSTHSVVTAHRGLPSIKLFRELDRLEIGDRFYIHNIQTVLCYEVDNILVVEPYDFEPVLVVEGEDLCTLLTCTPYMVNSHRLLVRGKRVDYTPPVKEINLADNLVENDFKDYMILVYPVVAVLFVLTAYLVYDNIKLTRRIKSIEDEIDKK